MNKATALDRLRASNPAPSPPLPDPALLDSILSEPGDPRLVVAPRRSRKRRRRVPVRIAIVAALVAVGSASALAAAGDGPLALWSGSPDFNPDPASVWHQEAVASTVHLAAQVTIPGEGGAQLWFAKARQGGFCTALKLPDGTWAGGSDLSGRPSPLDLGGTVPGCQPTREQINADGPEPILEISGMDYEEGLIATADGEGGIWRVYYGLVEPGLGASRVVARASGAGVPVGPGGEFAIALRDPDPMHPGFNPGLIAVGADGTVVAHG